MILLLLWLLPFAYFGITVLPKLLQAPKPIPDLFGQTPGLADSLHRQAVAWPASGTFFQSGVTYYNAGMLQAAADDLEQAIALNPRSAMAYYKLCVVQNDMGLNGAAAQSCRKALQLFPDFELAKYRLSLAEGGGE